MIGKTLGHYRIGEQLGRGGMGEVYLADALNLHRQVARKVLPESFAADPERMARFQREAKLLASLNHPNIAAIYGLEQAEGKRFLVLELVEGVTLAQRLSKGALPVDEALGICRQIAEGLEAAHEKGVIHRDLKPANVMITEGDKVKILDFGLAKALSDETQSVDSSQSPTLTEAMTRPGVILGTAAYMSPEQAKGKAVDKRADIWAFGCVLYECLTRRRAFEGEAATEALAAVLTREPAWNLLPSAVPRPIAFTLRRCLRKDPKLRFRDIADVRIELDEVMEESGTSGAIVPRPDRRSQLSTVFPWVLSCGLAILVLAGLLHSWKPQRSDSRPLMHFNLLMPGSPPLALFKIQGSVATPNYGLTISPDAKFVVYLADIGTKTQLYLRRLNRVAAEPIAFTEDASGPFISPDGQWVAFFARGQLKKVFLQGGPPKVVCNAPMNSRGGSWGDDGTIIFALASGGLWHVSAEGGTPKQITSLDQSRGEISHRFPRLLPGGRAVIFTIKTNLIDSFDDAEIAVARLGTGERHILVEGGSFAEYLPSGHIVYAHGGSLMAVPFDVSRLAITGPPKLVLGGVMADPSSGAAMFGSSSAGILAYAPGTNHPFEGILMWQDQHGKLEQLSETRCYADVRLSPNGQHLAVRILAANDDIWLYEISRRAFSRLTLGGGNYYAPVWTPDGKRLIYSSDKTGRSNLYWKDAEGSGAEQRLTTSDFEQSATSVTPDCHRLLFDQDSSSGGRDIWTLTMQADEKPRPFIQTPFDEHGGAVSPDGRWVAYVSNDSGRDEVYVQSFPSPARRWTISNAGGKSPIWGIRGNELFYRNGDKMMLVAVRTRPTFSATSPRVAFDLPPHVSQYDMAHDGRFLIIQNRGQASVDTLNVIINWFEELEHLVPTGTK
jgi:serine/threonine protein kinase